VIGTRAISAEAPAADLADADSAPDIAIATSGLRHRQRQLGIAVRRMLSR
jgi:hypothetical protein